MSKVAEIRRSNRLQAAFDKCEVDQIEEHSDLLLNYDYLRDSCGGTEPLKAAYWGVQQGLELVRKLQMVQETAPAAGIYAVDYQYPMGGIMLFVGTEDDLYELFVEDETDD